MLLAHECPQDSLANNILVESTANFAKLARLERRIIVDFAQSNLPEARSVATRVLLVDDHAPWRRLIRDVLENVPDLEIVAEASDGRDAVQKAQEFQPDLILLDIGLPRLNGFEAARQIRNCSPQSKILIISELCAPEFMQEALRIGVHGYVVKSHAGRELLPALNVVLGRGAFVSSEKPETVKPHPFR